MWTFVWFCSAGIKLGPHKAMQVPSGPSFTSLFACFGVASAIFRLYSCPLCLRITPDNAWSALWGAGVRV